MSLDNIYHALDESRKQIRVLHINGSDNSDDALECSLETVSLLSQPKPCYEAISYCWGDTNTQECMRLNGIAFDAPKSAAEVLRQFRTPLGSTRCVWLDALCINQADVAERSSQVSMMGEVYRSCTKCLIWLGDADERIELLLHTLQFISDNHFGCSSELASNVMIVDFDQEKGYRVLSMLTGLSELHEIYAFFGTRWFTRV